MSNKIRGLWSIAAIAAISLAMTTGVTTSKNAYATEDATKTEGRSRVSEMVHKPLDAEKRSRDSSVESRTEVHMKTESTNQEQHKEVVREKLSANKLKACEKRQVNINSHTERIADRGTKHLALLTKITDRVKAFYVTKGNMLANYDALVADVDAKKAAADAAVQSIASSTSNFTCSDGNPKQSVEGFKANLTLQHTALKEYKVAVKNLIVGVKSVNSTTVSSSKGNE